MKINWDFEEAVALVNTYINVTEKGFDEQAEIQVLSEVLVKRADILGIEHDDIYRNPTGINMKLKNIEYLATDGQSGLSSYSLVDKKALELYNKLPETFELIIKEFKQKYK